MFEKAAVIKSKYGIHARPSAAICSLAKNFPEAKIFLIDPLNGSSFDTKSILQILTLNKMCGDTVLVRASGKDEIKAVEDIVLLIETFEVDDE